MVVLKSHSWLQQSTPVQENIMIRRTLCNSPVGGSFCPFWWFFLSKCFRLWNETTCSYNWRKNSSTQLTVTYPFSATVMKLVVVALMPLRNDNHPVVQIVSCRLRNDSSGKGHLSRCVPADLFRILWFELWIARIGHHWPADFFEAFLSSGLLFNLSSGWIIMQVDCLSWRIYQALQLPTL